ncbi:unnamed protein product [Diamesa serratosioi]
MLLNSGILKPGKYLSIEYLGQKFIGDLLPDGKIKSQETEAIFLSPSAWAINCKKIINPEKKSGCGWASVKYNGKKLDIYKAMYHKKCQQQKDQLDQNEEEKIVEKRSTEFPKALKKETYQYGTIINRNTTHDYFSAVETVSFTSLGKMQPFLISLTSSSMLLMDFHCHLTTDEVVGYLGGFWDINSQTLSVTHVFPCLNSPLDRNKAGNVEYEIQKKMIQSDCTLVGWYHSHPQFNPQPTLRDIDNQLNYEMIMRGTSEATYSPCFGLIYGTYHEDDDFDNESKMLPFIVIPPHENRQHELSRPVMMNMDIKQDQTLPNGIKDQMIETFNYYKTLDYELVNFAEMKMNEDQMVIDKMKNSLYPKFPLEDQLNNNLWNWIRELIGLEQEENIAIPKKCLEKQRQPSSSPRDSPATISSNAPSPAKFEIPVRASPSPAKSDASSNRTRNSPAPSPGKGHMPDRPTRNSSSISSSSSKYDYSSLAGMNPSHLTSAAALAGTGSSNNYHSSPSGGNNKKSSSSYSNSQHHHQQQQQQQQQQQLQQLQQLQQQQQQHLQQPSTSGGSQNNNANNWLSQIPNMKEFMSQLEKSEAGKIADLMKSPEYTQMLMNQANAFRGLGTEITVTRKSGSNKKSSSSSSSHSGSNQNSGSNAQSSGGGSGGGGGNSGAGNSLLNQLPVMDLNYLAEISKSIPELNALLNSNKPEDINALLQMQMMAKSSMDYASQLFGTGGGPTSGSSSGNSNKNNSNSASAKAMQDYAQAAASSNMLSQYMSGMTGMGGGQNLSSLFGPMYGMGSMESPPPEHQKQSSSNSRKRDNSSRNSGNYQTALAAASAVPSSTTNVAPNAADLLNSLFTNSSKGNSFLGSHDLSAYFGGMPAASNNPHSHLTSSSKSSNNSSSGGGITSGLDYSALFSQMSPAKLQEMTSLFSQAKYPGIPDPLAKSTLAANNMYYGASLSPSLMKLQQEALNTRLMKPPKSSSSSSSSSKIDTPPPPPISASPHRSTPTKSSQRDSPAMPGKYNFSVADLSVSSHPLAATDFSRKSTPTPPSSTSQTPPIKKRMEFSSIAELVAPSPSKRQKYDDDDDDVPAVLNLSNN